MGSVICDVGYLLDGLAFNLAEYTGATSIQATQDLEDTLEFHEAVIELQTTLLAQSTSGDSMKNRPDSIPNRPPTAKPPFATSDADAMSQWACRST